LSEDFAGGELFSQELAEIREQKELLNDLDHQIGDELADLAALQAELARELVAEGQRKSDFRGAEPGTIEEEEESAQMLRAERDGLQEKITSYLKTDLDESGVKEARAALKAVNLELDIKNSLIRGMQGKEPLSIQPLALESHRKGRFYTRGLPRYRERQAVIKSAISSQMESVAKLREIRSKEASKLLKALKRLGSSVRSIGQLEVSKRLMLSQSSTTRLTELLRRWKSQELTPPDDAIAEYFERRNHLRGISRTWLMRDLEERGHDGPQVIRKFGEFFSQKLPDELAGELLIFTRQEFFDFFEEILAELKSS
jgi:hypothetical protein